MAFETFPDDHPKSLPSRNRFEMSITFMIFEPPGCEGESVPASCGEDCEKGWHVRSICDISGLRRKGT